MTATKEKPTPLAAEEQFKLPIYRNIAQCARMTGIPQGTIEKANKAGCSAFRNDGRIVLTELLPFICAPEFTGAGEVLSLQEEKAMQIRQTRLDQEREARVRENELAEIIWFEKMLTEKFILPLTAAFNDAPTGLSVRCNPSDPEIARVVIEQWCEGCKRTLREGLKQ